MVLTNLLPSGELDAILSARNSYPFLILVKLYNTTTWFAYSQCITLQSCCESFARAQHAYGTNSEYKVFDLLQLYGDYDDK